jgi:sec-independent protein translocase protein TatA
MHTLFAFFGGLGGWEILLIMMVLLIFFGAKKIPELARGLGRGIREFKDATSEIKKEIEEGTTTTTNSSTSDKQQ